MASVKRVQLSRAVREVLEGNGLGASVWREQDCVSVVRGVIKALSGQDNEFGAEAWTYASYDECRKESEKHLGSLEKGYLRILEAEPRLVRRTDSKVSIGDIGLSMVPSGKLGDAPSGGLIPVLCVIGPGYRAYTRAPNGIRPVRAPYAVWSVTPNVLG